MNWLAERAIPRWAFLGLWFAYICLLPDVNARAHWPRHVTYSLIFVAVAVLGVVVLSVVRKDRKPHGR